MNYVNYNLLQYWFNDLLVNALVLYRPCSLNNTSDTIRWSLDLRWQRMDRPVGFHGLKEGVQMRSTGDPKFQIDWDTFEGVNRHEEAFKVLDQVK